MNTVSGICQAQFYAVKSYGSAARAKTSVEPVGEVPTTGDAVEISTKAQKIQTVDAALQRSEELMSVRGLDDEEIASFREILSSYESSGMNADEFLKSLSGEERNLVKLANSYGSNLTDNVIDSFSEEGAINMLREQDYRFAIDLNGDDIVEHGAGRTFVFPPPNTPDTVMDAWDTYSRSLTGAEESLFSALFLPIDVPGYPDATTIRGYNISQQGFPPNEEGWLDLLDKIYDTLKYNNKISNDQQTIEYNKKAMQQLRDFAATIEQMKIQSI
ncbi:MAG: hypothetical protein KJ826_06185 [Proteobacteria bacterium]|nr:hypothetical protein [Pseudomonadota bacterium]